MNKPKVGVFCPSDPLVRTPKLNYAYLRDNGIEVIEHPQTKVRSNYLAGSISERIEAIHSLLKDDTIDILMSFWGGGNSNQLLPYLDFELFKKYPKPIVGFSDVTALLLAIHTITGNTTYMGASGITFNKPEPLHYSFEYFKKLVIDKEKGVLIKDSSTFADDLYFLKPDNDHRIIQKNPGRKIFRHGKAEGIIIAANLQTLLVLAGTKYFPHLEGKILFLEEAGSATPSMIHRFFTHLSQIIDINSFAGICIGRFPSQCGFTKGNTEEMIYQDVFQQAKIPIVYNLDFGHTDPLFTIPIGGRAIIDTDKGVIEIS